MTRDEARRAAEVMMAYADGALIQVYVEGLASWISHTSEEPLEWDWTKTKYRVAPTTPDTIDWSHVAPEYKWMVRQNPSFSPRAFLCKGEPDLHENVDCYMIKVEHVYADAFASYQRGTCDWRESLVQRPEGE